MYQLSHQICRIVAALENWYPLKCGFLKKSFIMNAPLVSCPFPVITFGWVQQQTHPKVMTGNGQLTRGAFIINDFFRNPHFKWWLNSIGIFDKITYLPIFVMSVGRCLETIIFVIRLSFGFSLNFDDNIMHIQSNLAIKNFLVTKKLFLKVKCSVLVLKVPYT